jgi:hypothetical protein
VDEVGNQFRLADKVLDELLLVRVVLADDFDGNSLYEIARAVLLRLVHNAHSAFEDLSNDFVAELTLDGEKGHYRDGGGNANDVNP